MSVRDDLAAALTFLNGGTEQSPDEEMLSRTAIGRLLRSLRPPAALLEHLAERFDHSAWLHESLPSRQEPSGEVIWRDARLTSEERDIANAVRYLDRGFTSAPGKRKTNGGYSSHEIMECQQAIARLLRKSAPAPLLMSLAADFEPTIHLGNSEGFLKQKEGRFVLGHRRRGRNNRIISREVVASMMQDRIHKHGSVRQAAVEVAETIGLSSEAVRSRWKKWKAGEKRGQVGIEGFDDPARRK